jgi:nitroimidazol reductase NimA-like FMN-containing flavoprotein (pyridoxamine 5'-phosphate oxidase superfamily)
MTERKWLYEILLEKLPPFSRLPKWYNVLFQLGVMEIVGISIATFYSLSIIDMIYGSLAIVIVIIWSALAYHTILTVRGLKKPSAPLEREVIEEYVESLFGSRGREVFFGLLFSLSIFLYLAFQGNDLATLWLGQKPNPVILFFVALLLWDISYRLGLGLWTSFSGFKRSLRLAQVSRMRSKMRYTEYSELKTLRRLDIINILFGLVSLMFFPLSSTDLIFFGGLLVYATTVISFSVVSIATINRIPGFPIEIVWLLNEGKIGYVGTSDRKMQPHLTPVIFVFDAPNIFFVISKKSKKRLNIKENNNIAFLVDIRYPNNLNNNRAVLLTGKASIYNQSGALMAFYRLLRIRRKFYQKHPEYMLRYKKEENRLPLAWRTTIFVSRLLVRVDVKKMVYWREARPISLPVR